MTLLRNYIQELKQDNMNEEITAKWARETAETALNLEAAAQLQRCLNAIKKAAKNNSMSCSVDMVAQKTVITELTHRGFKCHQNNDQRDGAYFTIVW